MSEYSHQAAQTGKRPARILILDDEPCISELLGEMLRMLGYDPTLCASPRAALQLLEKQEFDVILSDFRMPEMNGGDFFLKATAQRPELAGRIIFLTGDSTHEDTERFLKRHSTPHLSKPFDLAKVEQLVSEIVGRAGEVVAA